MQNFTNYNGLFKAVSIRNLQENLSSLCLGNAVGDWHASRGSTFAILAFVSSFEGSNKVSDFCPTGAVCLGVAQVLDEGEAVHALGRVAREAVGRRLHVDRLLAGREGAERRLEHGDVRGLAARPLPAREAGAREAVRRADLS